MSDIVERLRETVAFSAHGKRHKRFRNPDGPAAADEIEALRAEVERMREALAFIGHLATCDHGHAHYCPNCDRSLSEIGDTVQTALTQTKDTTDDALSSIGGE